MVAKLKDKPIEQIDIEVAKIIGMDMEPEDRSVGIFGNWFNLGFEVALTNNSKKKNLWIGFGDDCLYKLLELLKPYYERQRAEEGWEREEERLWKEAKESEEKC